MTEEQLGSPREKTGSVFSADGTAIGFAIEGAGPLLVLVEPVGHFREFSAFDALVPLLAAHFLVVTYDRRGRGSSADAAPYSPQCEVEDLAAIIAEFGDSAFVYGYSSGALLALHAAAAGIGIERLVVLEPPLHEPCVERPDPLTTRLEGLLVAERNAEVVAAFHESIGVPEEFIDQMRATSHWEAMVTIAPTFVYDCIISDVTTLEVLAAVAIPTLVLDSDGSTDDLTGSAAQAAARLPNATNRSLPGEWHTVADDILAAAILDHLDPSANEPIGTQS